MHVGGIISALIIGLIVGALAASLYGRHRGVST
jgi:hypothetical protein